MGHCEKRVSIIRPIDKTLRALTQPSVVVSLVFRDREVKRDPAHQQPHLTFWAYS